MCPLSVFAQGAHSFFEAGTSHIGCNGATSAQQGFEKHDNG